MLDEVIELTRENIDALRSDRGGFTKGTTEALGVFAGRGFKLPRNWLRKLVGRKITKSQYDEALRLRNSYSSVTLKIRGKE